MSVLKSAGGIASIVATLLLVTACGASSSANRAGVVEGRDGNSFNWGVIFTPAPRTVKIGSSVGYCMGDPRPRIEKPAIEYRGEDVYIRLELKVPAPRQRRK